MCLHLALRAPELVERLVIVGAHPGICDEASRLARRLADDRLAADLEEGGEESLAQFVDKWLQGPLFADLSGEQADRPSRLGNSAAGLAASLRTAGTGTQSPLWERLSGLEMPVLVVVGARDDKFRPIAEATAQAIGRNAQLAVIADAGHAACFERPADLSRSPGRLSRPRRLSEAAPPVSQGDPESQQGAEGELERPVGRKGGDEVVACRTAQHPAKRRYRGAE